MTDAMKLAPVEPTEAMIEAAGDAPWSDARRAATNVYDRRNITVADMLRAGIAAAPSAPQGVRFDVEAYVENYEFRSDEGDHTPDENERGVLIDAIHGVLSELESASPPAREEAPGETMAATYEEILRTVCGHLGLPQSESGPADDVALYDRALESLLAELASTEAEKVEHRKARYVAEASLDGKEAPAEGAGEIEDLKAANKDHCRAVNTLTLEAIELERQIADLRAYVVKANSGFEEYERKFYLASDEVERLKLAICGGEDVPGSINAVSVEDCERFITEERGRHVDTEARISAAGVGFDGGSLTLGALERARSEYDSGFQDGRAEEFRKAQPEYDFKAEDEWFEHVLSRPDDYEGPDAGMHDTEIVENEDV